MQKVVADFTVTANIALNSGCHALVLQSSGELLPILPGQFVNVEIPGNKEVFLRRPFSVYEVDDASCSLTLLVKILGRGSATLARVAAGEKLSLVYPLGKGFTMPAPGDRVLAVGGGSGVAPLLFLARRAALPPDSIHLLLGAKTEADHIDVQKYTDCATFYFTTEDGKKRVKGMVTDHPLFGKLSRYNKIYACGPLAMMKAAAAGAVEKGIFCEVSLENLMACGFGVCLCCIEPTVKGNLCVCSEGPVFNINDLTW